MSNSLPWAFLAATGGSSRLVRSLFDNTFAGVHQLAWFDWAMLIPYFTILLVLSVYGIHRYDIIRTYFKLRKNATGEPMKRFDAASASDHSASAI